MPLNKTSMVIYITGIFSVGKLYEVLLKITNYFWWHCYFLTYMLKEN